jgi:hypothetical protein
MDKTNHPALSVLKLLLAALAALTASLLSGLLLQPFNPMSVPQHPEFFRLLFGSCLVLGPALWYLVDRSASHGVKLLGLALVVYIGAAQVMAHFETVAFNFLFQFTPAQLVFLVVSEALTALILVPLIVTVAGKWKAPPVAEEDRVGE